MAERQAEAPDVNICLPIGFIEHLSAATSLDDLLDVTASWLDTVVECDRSSLTILSEDGDALELHAVGNKTIMTSQTRLEFDSSIVGRSFVEQQLINLDDISGSTLTDLAMLWELGIGSILVAPLVSAGRAFGTLNVGRYAGRSFSRRDELSLRSMASLLASYISVHRQIEREQKAARVDHLTGLLNRRAILEVLETSIEDEVDDSISVLFLDLDGFKRINDTHGHATGDALLIEISRRLAEVLRDGDMIGRLGGDEFLAICRSGIHGEPADVIAERLVRECGRPFAFGSAVVSPKVSVGLTTLNSETKSIEDLLAEADYAMYQAKNSTSSIAVMDEQFRAQADLLVAVDRDLVAAIETEQMSFFYQAIESLETAEIVAAEALLRWDHPEHGPIPPTLILERIEASGLIERFTQWSLDKLGREWSAIQQAAPSFRSKAVSLNVNPSQLGLEGYCEWHMAMLNTHQLRADDVIVEMVEPGFDRLTECARSTLRRLADEGVVLALDDFGAWYNAISYFSSFPIHAVKFDRALIRSMTDDPQVRTLVSGMTQVSRGLGIIVVAEGVERQAEVDLLLEMGVGHAQGRFLSPPMAASEFEKVARRNEVYEHTLRSLV